MTDQHHDYNTVYQKAFDMLNPAQRAAVLDVTGPVMTLAGPGTGKTQLLAVRIGHILQSTDASPREILALTFTDAGAFAMRKRLRSFIGPAANEVTISTFHAFCSQVIVENLEAFGEYRDLQPLSDLEAVRLLRSMIDEAPIDHPLKRLKSSPYYNMPKMKDLFATMKRERWTHQDLVDAVAALEQRAHRHDSFVAKRKTKSKTDATHSYLKGDIRTDKIEAYISSFDDLLAVAHDIDRYNQLLEQQDRYDYGDMIGWVLQAFENNDTLLARYQEQYQYILVDEYQDTNRSQNQLVNTLASYWEEPNVFVVGDDDQSIYRFQGADMTNIKAFIKDYSPRVHVLEQNYRSVQPILDKATLLIAHNKGRIAKGLGIDKRLVASHPDRVQRDGQQQPTSVTLHQYANTMQEEAGIIQKIQDLHRQGVAYSAIAVLYTKHSVAQTMIRYLAQTGTPVEVKRKVNVLKEIDVIRMIRLLTYIQSEYDQNDSGEHLLFDILHYDFFGLRAVDLGMISLHCRYDSRGNGQEAQQLQWRAVIRDEKILAAIGVSDVAQIVTTAAILEEWIEAIPNYTIQMLYEKVMTESKLLYHILQSSDATYRLQVINSLFEFVKVESAKKPDLTLTDLLSMLEQMEEEGISLDIIKTSSARDAVQFMTLHGSKGLEFDHVFMVGTHEGNWEAKRGRSGTFKYPQRELPEEDPDAPNVDLEEMRRLFFVALTRAAQHVYITYAARSNGDKDQLVSAFVGELDLDQGAITEEAVDPAIVLDYQAELLRYQKASPQLIDHDLIDRVLERFVLSSTSLNKYLRCPTTFYYEDILRVPSARSSYIGYGNAVHYSLETYFEQMRREEMQVPAVSVLLQSYGVGLKKFASHFTTDEYKRLSLHGQQSLQAYYDQYSGRWTGMIDVKPEHKIKQTEHAGVPIKGTIDKIEIYQDRYVMVDYKTGSTNTASKKLARPKAGNELGGDYWRQVVFYKLLLLHDAAFTKKVDKGVMDFVDKTSDGRYRRQEYDITEEDVTIVTQQIVETYEGIQNHAFEQGCKEEDCKWCQFVATNRAEVLLERKAVDEDDERQRIEL